MRSVALLFVLAFALAAGCVTKSAHRQALDEAARKLRDTEGQLAAMTKDRDTLAEEAKFYATKLDQRDQQMRARGIEIAEIDARLTERDAQLTSAQRQTESLSTTVESLKDVEKRLRDEQDGLRKDRDALMAEKAKLTGERAELEKEISELRRLRAASEARAAEFQKLLKGLHKMIDAGSLEVKLRNGLMQVTLPNDVLFAPGEAVLKPEAVTAIKELAETLKTFPDRRFQVVGHTDSQPIKNELFASNWHLSTARALAVVSVLVEAGVAPKTLSAAGAGEFDPVAKNTTAAERAKNRRVELIFVPQLKELPGFEEVAK